MSNNIRNQPMYVQAGNLENENVVASADLYPGMLGSRVTVNVATGATGGVASGGGKTYQRVQVDSTAATAPYPGAVAWWSNKSAALVTTDPTKLGRGRIAGVFRNAISPGNIGFIQTQGPSTVKIIDTPTAAPTAAGLIVIPSATAGKADVLAAGSAATYPALGVTTGAVQGGTSVCPVDLDVQETP